MSNTNLENSKTNMKTRIRNRVGVSTSPRDLGRLAKSARFVGLVDDADVETDLDTQMAAAIPSASIDDLVEIADGINELRDRAGNMGGVSSADHLTEGGNKFLNANSVQPALSVSGDLSYNDGVVSYSTPTSAALQVVATVGDLPAGASAGDQAVVQSNNNLYIKTADGWYAVALINTAPTISGNNATYELATDGTPTVITMTATDPENDPVTFSHSVTSGALNGTTVEQNNNVFTITPHASNPATFTLAFSADDSVNVATSSASSFTLVFVVVPNWSGLDNTPEIQIPNWESGQGVGDNIVLAGDILIASTAPTGTHPTTIVAFDISDTSGHGGSALQYGSANVLWSSSATNSLASYSNQADATETMYVGKKGVSGVPVLNPANGNLYGYIDESNHDVYTTQVKGNKILTMANFNWWLFEVTSLSPFAYTTLATGSGGGQPFWHTSSHNAHPYGYDGELSDTVVALVGFNDTWGGQPQNENGAPEERANGRVHLFDHSGSFLSVLTSPDAPEANRENAFGGYAMNGAGGVQIVGTTMFIGEVGNHNSTVNPTGSVHVYDISNPSSPSLTQTITPASLGITGTVRFFGGGMSSSNNALAIGYNAGGGNDRYAILNISDVANPSLENVIHGPQGGRVNMKISENSSGIGTFAAQYAVASHRIDVFRTI
tara:strand:- start:697 stop:2697 length:2001 start_codon:yes stop_codon:yes gene_type:complete